MDRQECAVDEVAPRELLRGKIRQACGKGPWVLNKVTPFSLFTL